MIRMSFRSNKNDNYLQNVVAVAAVVDDVVVLVAAVAVAIVGVLFPRVLGRKGGASER